MASWLFAETCLGTRRCPARLSWWTPSISWTHPSSITSCSLTSTGVTNLACSGPACCLTRVCRSDHYGGLGKSFDWGTIYCNSITASLVRLRLGVGSRFIHVLPMNKPTVVEGVEVTLLDANHCPGSAMVLFRLRDGRCFLHVGPFRGCTASLNAAPLLLQLQLLLLTTACYQGISVGTAVCAVTAALRHFVRVRHLGSGWMCCTSTRRTAIHRTASRHKRQP